jgi:multidrug resistance efflux pump
MFGKPLISWTGGALSRVGKTLIAIPGQILRSASIWIVLILVTIVVVVVYYGLANTFTPFTNDAYVQAYVVQMAPQVPGEVITVAVVENQHVSKGDLLFALDPRPFEHRVHRLEAGLAQAIQQIAQMESELAAARADEAHLAAEENLTGVIREQEDVIYKQNSTSERKFIDARQKHKSAVALLDRSRAIVRQKEQALEAKVGNEHALIVAARDELATARLDLEWSRVTAPCDGYVTDLQLRKGAYVAVGRPVLTCIDSSRWWVVANFRENSLEQIRPGQRAALAFKTYPGRVFPAKVDTVGLGVGQGQGVPSGELPTIRTPSAWIPVPQRFQVRVVLDHMGDVSLRVGATASVTIYNSDSESLNFIAEAWQKFESWLYYLR